MALITCPECKKKISDTTNSCPKCGYKLTPEKVAEIKKKEQQAQKGCGIGCLAVIIIMALYMIGSFSSDSKKTEPSTSSVSNGQEKLISGDQWFGCTDRKYFDKLVGYAVQKDNEAFTKALSAGLLIGTCTIFKTGEVVYIADTAILSGIIKVRRKGETKEYWTNMEAVK